MNSDFTVVSNLAFSYTWQFFSATWWIILFPILLITARSAWFFWRQTIFLKKSKFVLLEMKMPREVTKSPRAMDQVLYSISSYRNIWGFSNERWIDGEVPRPFSFEIVSFGGEIHFYVRTPEKVRTLTEAAFFSYYPDVELTEVEDYTKQWPKNYADIRARGLEFSGFDFTLAREAAYPIRSYLTFEAVEEDQQIDPLSTTLETLSRVKKDEVLAIQINAVPMDSKWRDPYKDFVEELRRVKFSEAGAGSFPLMMLKSPRETDILKAVEMNLSKPAFQCTIRILYFAPQNVFYDSFARRVILSSFNQYSAHDLNSFKQNVKYAAFPPGAWYKTPIPLAVRSRLRRQRVWNEYRERFIPPTSEAWWGTLILSHPFQHAWHAEPAILNTESLATIFHPPSKLVLTAPHTPRVESHKGSPPAGLPIFGDEEALKEFNGK